MLLVCGSVPPPDEVLPQFGEAIAAFLHERDERGDADVPEGAPRAQTCPLNRGLDEIEVLAEGLGVQGSTEDAEFRRIGLHVECHIAGLRASVLEAAPVNDLGVVAKRRVRVRLSARHLDDELAIVRVVQPDEELAEERNCRDYETAAEAFRRLEQELDLPYREGE